MLGMLDLTGSAQSFDELDDIPADIPDSKYSFFMSKYIIPYSLRESFLKELKKANISYLTLFPDKYGYIKDLF